MFVSTRQSMVQTNLLLSYLMARVMVADDSEAIRLVLRDILAIGKHELVYEAVNGEDTIDGYLKTKPEVLLLDLAMPKKSGLDIIRELKPKFPELKIIIVSASSDDKLISQCIKEGASNFISKPFVSEKILKTISETVSH